MANYAHPETLVSTEWVAEHAQDPHVRVVEVDVDTKAYDEGHVPGALAWAWNTQLCDTAAARHPVTGAVRGIDGGVGHHPRHHPGDLRRQQQLVRRMGALAGQDLRPPRRAADERRPQEVAGGRPRTFHRSSRGDRARPTTRRKRTFLCARFCRRCRRPRRTARRRWWTCAARRSSPARFWRLRDCRKPASAAATFPARAAFRGARPATTTAPSNPPTNCAQLYGGEGIDGSRPVIAYCRIGERSSHTWFVLKYLLGFDNVTNYDGSWTEWGNLVGVPVERGAAAAVAHAGDP